MSSSEQKGFVFSITFIIVFAALLASIPAGLQGEGGTAETLLPVDPDLIADFADSREFTKSDFTYNEYHYDNLGGFDWVCWRPFGSDFRVARKIKLGGAIWLGGLKHTEFVLDDDTNRGEVITLSEIETDAEEGTVRYDLKFVDSGEDAGGFLFYWNTTTYSNPTDAWNGDGLHLLHGIGLDSSAPANVVTLLVNLLFLQLPDVPTLVNILIATPIWACIVFLIWYVIKESMPFV